MLTNLAAKVDKLIIGGAMANTFFLAEGVEIGKSLAEPDHTKTALEIMHAAKARHCEVLLAARLRGGAEARGRRSRARGAHAGDALRSDDPRCRTEDDRALRRRHRPLQTLLWNGPLGAFEVAPFGEGTFALARAAAALTRDGKLVSVAGGGDTVAALNAAGVTHEFTYVSTAGGAFLEWLEGRTLPGIAALAGAQS